MSGEPAQPWYATPDPETGETGLRFSCTQCGACCSGPPGDVRFTMDEANEMAAHLGISTQTFLDRYTQLTPVGLSLTDKPAPAPSAANPYTKEGHTDCVFLDRESSPGKALCSIYEVRPEQCRTWPFWPDVVRSRTKWAWFSRNVCPGMGKGELRSPERVQQVTLRGR